MGDNKSFDATEFFAGEPNLPTILEGDEKSNIVTSSPTESPEPIKSNVEEPKSNTTTTSNETRPNSPDTDNTVVEVVNVSSESLITPSKTSSGSNTPRNEKGIRSSNKRSQSTPTRTGINSRSNTPDINRLSRRKNRESSSTPTGSRATSRSRSNTPDISKRRNTAFLQSENHEMRPIREPLTSANFIHIGVPGEINFPSANIRELTIGVFHIFNPTEKQISWRLSPAGKPTFRRLGTATNAAVEVEDDIFKVMKPRGFLGPKHAERVDVHFCPLSVGSYMQTFVLEDASETGTNDVDSVSMKFQGVATENTFSALLQKHRPPKKEVKFEVEGSEIKMPPTRIGKQRSMGIKITNVSKESIRLTCKVETSTGPGGKFVLSLPMNSVVIKPEGFSIIPVRFQPRAEGEVKGIVTIQSINNVEIKVDVIAKGILDNRQSTSIANHDSHS
ncbi:hypothetical protein RclHR1_08750003 [Rhizophagus clarus]|uniref:Centrosomal protein of 192 kDa n=1 Tax=Rhizophagus clarus TaxID=94130 RepID=A0A2Z6S264_9GLOM|nr:hypothetical protein RclHR1_08750003 [Rhizophagus clarus]GES79389.1 centrosomal protein of 192 kDa [Rhizophagus clarus]